MKIIFFFLILFSQSIIAREKGQTEITTEEGIEVFQKEKYYLLKKNVNIVSDDYVLSADFVKAFFDKDLYDVHYIESEGSVNFKSSKDIEVTANKLNFSTRTNKISIYGKKSFLKMQNLEMRSEEYIEINDFAGTFELKGENSELKTKDLIIIGSFISGSYDKSTNKNEIISLNTKSKNLSYINTNNLEMESTKAVYSKKDNIIELFDNVKVVRGGETITGDYAKINTLDQSYKVSSKDSSKVKVLINTTNE